MGLLLTGSIIYGQQLVCGEGNDQEVLLFYKPPIYGIKVMWSCIYGLSQYLIMRDYTTNTTVIQRL